ncbi:MAG: bacillithiol biosynthesis cysteine-adding enzyme BshC [Flavobacteriaceae bacterium]
MPKHCIPYQDTGYFSNLILDYLAQDPSVEFLYNRFPTLENFGEQITEKAKFYPNENRKGLVEAINNQYKNLKISKATGTHLKNLEQHNTFTITTGHQLNLFTGPLYFLYKIVSSINLCKELKKEYPENNFVPIYWMATEDHDFDEINFFNFREKKMVWDRSSDGAVGEHSTEGLQKFYETFSKELGASPNAEKLKTLFKGAYLDHNNLADATRYLANELFGEYGLVTLDANDTNLKQLFAPYIHEELFQKTSSESIEKTNEKINSIPGKNYKLQVNPREINLFYLKIGLRERIIEKEGEFYINNSKLKFSKSELESEIQNHPERFSPNVMLRPLYQEVVLPNLCYIGGGGELAYWLQLKDYFKTQQVTFPILLLRNSALLIPAKTVEKLSKLQVTVEDLFLKPHELKTKVTKQISDIRIDFSQQRAHLKEQFKALYKLAQQTDNSFKGAVAAQEKKQLNGLDNLEKRLLKAQKRKIADHLERVSVLQNELFPSGSLQERSHNFSEWYLGYGNELTPLLIKELQPLDFRFLVLEV